MRSKDSEILDAILLCIDEFYNQTGVTPSIREIAEKIGVSKTRVHNYVNELKENGLLESNSKFRGLRTSSMLKSNSQIELVPLVGSISCGKTIFAEQNIERYYPFPKGYFGSGKHYILRAFGNSMINAGINEGDHLAIRIQDTADNGQIVVALADNEATLKRFYKEKNRIRLHPENETLEDMYFDNIKIQGIAVKVIKDLI